jgi:hypothetical protein
VEVRRTVTPEITAKVVLVDTENDTALVSAAEKTPPKETTL